MKNKKKHVQKQNVWTYNFLHISIYYVYTRLSDYTNSKTSIKKTTFKAFGSDWRQDVVMSSFPEAPSSLSR